MDNPLSADSSDEHQGYALEAIERSEVSEELSDRMELLARAQAWATLHVADVLTRLVEALSPRRAEQ